MFIIFCFLRPLLTILFVVFRWFCCSRPAIWSEWIHSACIFISCARCKACENNDERMPGFGWFSSLGDSKLTYILQEPVECSSQQSRLSIVVQFKDFPAVATGQICYMERVEERELLRSVEFQYRCVNEAEMIFSASVVIPNPSLWIRLNPLFNQASVFSILQIAFSDQPLLS